MWCAKLLLSSHRVQVLLSTCGDQVGFSLVTVCGSSLVVVGGSSGIASGALVFLLRWGLHSSGGGVAISSSSVLGGFYLVAMCR